MEHRDFLKSSVAASAALPLLPAHSRPAKDKTLKIGLIGCGGRGKGAAFDALRAAFPAGTLSGAPKVRAMQIIDDLESHRRGIYGGAVGYFGPQGDADFGIAIRTLVAHQDRYVIQAGAGIVADSDPVKEADETEHKARAVVRAAQWAASPEACW